MFPKKIWGRDLGFRFNLLFFEALFIQFHYMLAVMIVQEEKRRRARGFLEPCASRAGE
jgi:hypothetical protein